MTAITSIILKDSRRALSDATHQPSYYTNENIIGRGFDDLAEGHGSSYVYPNINGFSVSPWAAFDELLNSKSEDIRTLYSTALTVSRKSPVLTEAVWGQISWDTITAHQPGDAGYLQFNLWLHLAHERQWSGPFWKLSGETWQALRTGGKPTWQDLVDMLYAHDLDADRFWLPRDREKNVDPARRALSLRSVTTLTGDAVHVGDGIDHMAGLDFLMSRTSFAGRHMPPAVMRRDDQSVFTVRLTRDVEDILDATVLQENRVQSAHNIVMARYNEAKAKSEDRSLSTSARWGHAEIARDIVNNYSDHMTSEIGRYDPDALPDDLDTLRELYVERLEASAMRRVKELKGAKTQQGVDLPASCLDQERALSEVSTQCDHGRGEIEDATTIKDAASAFANAVAAIEAVTPINVPVVTHTALGRVVTVTAKHPAGDMTVPGKVRIQGWSVQGATPDKVSARYTSAASVTAAATLMLTVATDVTGELTFLVRARNLCGPTDHKFTVSV